MLQHPDLAISLEDLLVKEFRICQALHTLTKNERQALTQNDVDSLSDIVEHKEAVLDELGQIDDQRRMVTQELAGEFGISAQVPTIADLAGVLNSSTGNRIQRIREGIVALTKEIHNITRTNQAIAITALERTDALQSFLLDLYRPNVTYQPPGIPTPDASGPALGYDQRT